MLDVILTYVAELLVPSEPLNVPLCDFSLLWHNTYFTDYKPINVIEESPQVIFVVEDSDPVVMIGRLNSFAAKETIWIDDVRPIHEIDQHLDFIFKPIKSKNPKWAEQSIFHK